MLVGGDPSACIEREESGTPRGIACYHPHCGDGRAGTHVACCRRHWVEFLSREHTLVRYDERGCGLSNRDCPTLTLEDWVVVTAAGVDRFSPAF